MDIGSYMQIDDLKYLLKENHIEIQRLRGLRLMKEEELISNEQLKKEVKEAKKDYAIEWLRQHSDSMWCSTNAQYCHHKSFICKTNEDGKKEVIDVDFTKVHGEDRKHIKFIWKKIEAAYTNQYEMFNKYVGKNVLYVHARQGGNNRDWYPIDTKHPMYLDDVDDAFDNTYCDIYYDLDKGAKNEIH